MVKNLYVYNYSSLKIDRRTIHRVVFGIKRHLNLQVDSLEINFLNAEQIRKINVKFLKHNYSTDIITFNYSDDLVKLDGEIFISVEDARQNAKKFGVLFENEIVRLIIHGILHMIGFDDTETGKKRIMKRKENELVKLIWDDSLKGIIKL